MNSKKTLRGDRSEFAPAGWIIGTVVLALSLLAVLFAVDRLYDPDDFQIRQIEVRGRLEQVDPAQIKSVVERHLKGNYFSLNLSEIEAPVAQLPGVFSASIRRRWPETLVVNVVEVRPVARWGEGHWLNSSGDLVARGTGEASGGTQGLPKLFGAPAHKHAIWQAFERWSAWFAVSGVGLDELRLDPRGLWHLQLSLRPPALGSVRAIAKQQDADARIERLAAVLQQELIGELASMDTIDLRYPNGFAVGWKTTSPEGRRLAAQTK